MDYHLFNTKPLSELIYSLLYMYESPHIFLYQFGHNYNAIYHFSCVRATFLLQLNGLFTCLPEIDIQITYLDVKPGPIRAGLSERWWTQELVLKNGVYFQSGKEPCNNVYIQYKIQIQRVNTFQNPYIHYLIRIFPRYNQHNSMSISCELMPWHQLWQQLIRRYQLTTVAEKYINQTATVNL